MKVVALIVALLFVAAAVPVFAQQSAQSAQGSGEKPVFQIVADTIEKPISIADKDKVKPIEKISIFQACADGITEGSKTARNESLRGK